jgi:hypothetical protein
MSQVETYRIYVSASSTPSTVLRAWNARAEGSRLLACLAYSRAVRGGSIASFAGSRRRGQDHDRTETL